MKLRNLLLLASIPFLLSPKLKAEENYTLVPDSSYHLTHPFPTNRISGIYQGSYSIKPTEDYIPLDEVKIESLKDPKRITKEIINPIMNDIINNYSGLEKLRKELENLLQNSITTDIGTLLLFDTYLSDNRLSIEENYSLRSLLGEKAAILYSSLEKVPTDNSFGGKAADVSYPHILIFESDTTEVPIDTTNVEQYTPPKDSILTETKKDSTEFKLSAPKKKNWRSMRPIR